MTHRRRRDRRARSLLGLESLARELERPTVLRDCLTGHIAGCRNNELTLSPPKSIYVLRDVEVRPIWNRTAEND